MSPMRCPVKARIAGRFTAATHRDDSSGEVRQPRES